MRRCFGEDEDRPLGSRSCWYLPNWGECSPGTNTSPGWCEERRLYSCQDPDEPNQLGQGTSRGCDAGCANCLDFPLSSFLTHEVPTEGNRFLAPSFSNPNRAADGLIRDIGKHPVRIPVAATKFRRAACWANDGLEGFGTCQCDCWPDHSNIVSVNGVNCPDGTPVGQPILGMIHDCYNYGNFNSPPVTECRLVNDHYEIPVIFNAGRLFNVANQRTHGCMANLMVACAGAAVNSECSGSFLNMGRTGAYFYDWYTGTFVDFPPYCPDTGPCFYMDPASPSVRQQFNFIRILGNTTRLRNVNSDPVLDAKNAVLEQLARLPEFNQMDFQGAQGNPVAADYWRRDMTIVPGMPTTSMPSVWQYPLSHLRHSGCSAPATLRIRNATIEMSLYIVQKTNYSEPSQVPYATIRIRAECVVTVVPPTDCNLSRPWSGLDDVSLVVDNAGGQYPVVTPPIDDMVFVDAQGRVSNPPVIVEWWGMLGEFSDPKTGNILDRGVVRPGNIQTACSRLWNNIRDHRIIVGGWPYTPSSLVNGPDQVYEGQLNLGF